VSVTVGDIERTLFERFPAEWAEPWDRVGLLAGDPGRAVTRVLVSLDPTLGCIQRALDAGANVLVTHHPVTLAPVERLLAGPGPSGVLFAAVDAGIALIAAHTNLDRAPQGAEALPALLGLSPEGVVERSAQLMSRVTVYAPPETADAITSAMAGVGAGRIGEYERSAFSAAGTGEFTPRNGSTPVAGQPGRHERVEELRIEMVCQCALTASVIAAARGAHPYEEPLIVAEEVEIARSKVGLGMLCAPEEGLTVAALAERASVRLRARPRVWGDADRPAGPIVTATGSASSLLGDVISSGAGTLVCGEVRYHDALSAAGSGLAIIECGHDVSEWPLTKPLAEAVRTARGIDSDAVLVEEASAAWWTA